jgi:hypothetical protein
MIIYDGSNKELMHVRTLQKDGDTLVIKGKIFGAMPMSARLTPAEARSALKLLTPGMFWFLLTFLLRDLGNKKSH